MLKKYKIGVVGAGARGESFARQLYVGSDRAELFGICDIDGDRLQKFVDFCELPNARQFTNPAEFYAAKEMDAVIITTPDFTHREVALQALAADKHLYIEKPLAPTAEEGRDIIRAQRASGKIAFVGFNLRAVRLYERLKEVVDSGVLGQIVHIDGVEQLAQDHSASFMRRFHRKTKQTGGLLNHKCSHDLDIIQWLIGHEHKVVKVASFGGISVFKPTKQPAKYCHECPPDTYHRCPYKDRAGFVFPVHGKKPIHKTSQLDVYGGDLCVYNPDKDIFDNQTVIMEWDNGVRGSFNLQLFQRHGERETRIWGEKGVARAVYSDFKIKIVVADTGDVIEEKIQLPQGGHGGSDVRMLGRFIDALDGKGPKNSGLSEGLAATIVAESALKSVQTGQIISVPKTDYL
jgi:predicted dehydrogenase